jgi:hypothetical protein
MYVWNDARHARWKRDADELRVSPPSEPADLLDAGRGLNGRRAEIESVDRLDAALATVGAVGVTLGALALTLRW